MKKFFDKIKDILYASVDYLIMLIIIAAVILIIGWRLDILFQKDILASVSENHIEVETQKEELSKQDVNINDIEILEEDTKTEDNSKDNEASDDSDVENDTIIQVNIPEGSLPYEIASILKTMDLIEDKGEFVKKAVDLNLDTKLKSGMFSISENSSLENIIKIISKQESGN